MTMYKHKAQIKQCTNIVPNICNIQCTNIMSNICNTSPLKEKFWKPRDYKILQEIFMMYTNTDNNILQNIFI